MRMQKKASWTVTLLLATLVPLANAWSSDCKDLKNTRDLVENIQDKIDNALIQSSLSANNCNDIQVFLTILTDEKTLKEQHANYCENSGPDCNAFNKIKYTLLGIGGSGAIGLRQAVKNACDARKEGGLLRPLYSIESGAYGKSKDLRQALTEAQSEIENLFEGLNTLIIHKCDADEVRNHTLYRSRVNSTPLAHPVTGAGPTGSYDRDNDNGRPDFVSPSSPAADPTDPIESAPAAANGARSS